MALSRPPKPGTSSNGSQKPVTPGRLLEGWPNVSEFLSMRAWDDGAPRKVGRLSVTTEGSQWRLTIADPEGGRVAFLTGPDLDTLLTLADEGLGSPDGLDWRPEKAWSRTGK